MQELAASTEPMPFLDDKIAVAMHLYHEAMQNLWKWRPTSASAAGAALLDGVAMSGECAQLVSGFKTLLRAPAPYGLGLPDGDIASEEWPTTGVVLFVVKHDTPYFGLHANVVSPDWKKPGDPVRFQRMYAWGNHKVLRVNCDGHARYFDPCYDQVYLLPEEMAEWRLTQADMGQDARRMPVVSQYRGRDRFGRPVAFRAIGGATPDLLKVRTPSGDPPVLVGPV
jgi:hypothetical protein